MKTETEMKRRKILSTADLHQGQEDPQDHYRLSDECIGSSAVEKDVVVEELDMSQQHALAAPKAKYRGPHQKKPSQQMKGGDSPTVLCSRRTPPGALHPALSFPGEEGRGPVQVGPEEGQENGLRAGTRRL